MEVTIKINGQALSVEVSVEVYECLDRADHKEENLAHEKRRKNGYVGGKRWTSCFPFWRAAPPRSAAGFYSTLWTV